MRECACEAFEFHLLKRPQVNARIRLPEETAVSSLTSLELLDLYWRASHADMEESEELQRLATEVIQDVHKDQEINP